ncbi:hypothetical protein SAMN04487965_0067 [Microbulbifer donghaiensis]|uniref:DUF2062 domain-containing protein n=2 Tax=Microbulbifer donghaiensis TaxID=494016 RepID=A0A1M4U5X5_9GAMM|nr:hypothetical protein SAMN04487965_0067 [Microbulbifer donghaiensis]
MGIIAPAPVRPCPDCPSTLCLFEGSTDSPVADFTSDSNATLSKAAGTRVNRVMPKSIIRRWLPTPEQVRANSGLKFLGTLLHDPNLFHLNRHSVSVAFAVGVFTSFLPLPGQMIIAALLALWFRCNLPLSMILVWISNPVTMPAIFYSTYKLGAWILGTPPLDFRIELSWEWLTEEVGKIWMPLFFGSLLAGIFFATVSYFTMQALWRWHVVKRWKLRLQRRSIAS